MKQDYSDVIKKLEELKELCLVRGLPMFATVGIEGDGETSYFSEVLTPLAIGKTLTNDKISRFNAALSDNFYIKIATDNTRQESAADLFSQILENDTE
jgi:hypothetical protein